MTYVAPLFCFFKYPYLDIYGSTHELKIPKYLCFIKIDTTAYRINESSNLLNEQPLAIDVCYVGHVVTFSNSIILSLAHIGASYV